MTIGIAAFGRDAGRAVLSALAAVESVGRGAIGGFASFAAVTRSGDLKRAECQRDGSAALFSAGLSFMPVDLAEAPLACVMSSGPCRPEPLSQFTPADPRVGMVTGHRMPNTVGVNGVSLNAEVLERMRGGASPAEAVEEVIAANPDADAGIIAIAIDGRVHAADAPRLFKRKDRGNAMIGSRAEGAVAAVLHNGIEPHQPIATLASAVAMDVMQPPDRPDGWIIFRQGVEIALGGVNAVEIDIHGTVERIIVDDRKFLAGPWSLGVGYEVDVRRGPNVIGSMLYEPYMFVDGGHLRTADGLSELSVPVRLLQAIR
jgi:hypothetical protein